jgi:uncharacterized protein YutE (UPF0331/DUF86 family)
MVISNLNIKLIEDRLGFIIKSMEKLRGLSGLEKGDFLKGDRPAAAESYLRRSLEAVFDIGRHIVAKTAGKPAIEYKEIARALSREGVITEELGETLQLMAGYRNRLVHFYHEVSNDELYEIVNHHTDDIERYIKEMRTFLLAYRKHKS